MDILTIIGIINYGLVLIFGLFLSTFFAGGWENRKQKHLIFTLCFIFLLIQSICWLTLSVGVTKKLYPFIVHIPLVLILVFALKKSVALSIVCVCTAYLCCQPPRWINLAVTVLSGSALAGELCYTLAIIPFFFLLYRYFVKAANDAMTYSSKSLYLFGSLPMAYYIFDYATVIYSNALHSGIMVLNEFLPTALIVFYVVFLTAYHVQTQERSRENLQNSMLEAELKQAHIEMENLRITETQAAIYHHDMRHHLIMINSFLNSDNPQQAKDYITKVQTDIEAIKLKRFCENNIMNLLCSSFADKAEKIGVQLKIDVTLPEFISVSDTELCSIISNGLENALNAVSDLKNPYRWIEFNCKIKQKKFLIEIKNPYAGSITMQNGLPVSNQTNHGYGCKSIRSITERHHGLCTFEADSKEFTLRIVLPLHDELM